MRIASWTVFALLVGLFVGCSSAPGPRQQSGVLDTPEHHVAKGLNQLDANRWREAGRSFDLALQLQKDHPEALSGKALVVAHDASEPGRSAERQQDLREQARELQEQAQEQAELPKTALRVWVNQIWLEALLQEDDWLPEAKQAYAQTQEILLENPNLRSLQAEPHYRMALAAQTALEFGQASEQFRKVLSLNLGYTREADQALARLNDIVRAQPGSRHGKAVALAEQLSRADLAALLVEEFRLGELYERSQVARTPSYSGPKQQDASGSQLNLNAPASDLSGHPLQADVEEVLTLGVRGLEVNPQKLFLPDDAITRAEFALVLEDILIKVLQDRSLSARFVGSASPWNDVRSDAYYYNAARTVVDRGLLTPQNALRGTFGPEASVTGAEALLGLRKLKDELNGYVRSRS